MLTNNVERLAVGECQYTLLLNERGGVIDDLIVYRIADARLSARRECGEDRRGFRLDAVAHRPAGVALENRSDDFAGLAVQGPRSAQLFDAFFGGKYSRRRAMKSCRSRSTATYYIARTGYTGEDGFEVFCPRGRRGEIVERHPARGRGIRHQAVRPRRARHAAPGDVLPAEWLRPLARAHADRGRARHFSSICEKPRFHRPRGARASRKPRA